MSTRLLKQNKVFVAIIIVLFILFSAILYWGGYYSEDESEWRKSYADTLMLSAEGVAEEFFSDAANDLLFLAKLLGGKSSEDTAFESREYIDEVRKILHEFGAEHKQYYQMVVTDSSGYEMVMLDNPLGGASMVVHDSQQQQNRRQYNIQQVVKLGRGQLYSSQITQLQNKGKPGAPNIPVMGLGTPLYDHKAEKRGVLILYIDVSTLLKRLPENTLIQTQGGDLLSLGADGSVKFSRSRYDFSDPSGVQKISDKVDLYYSTVEILPGKQLTVAMKIKLPLWDAIFYLLKTLPIIPFALFFFLILVIVYINVSRFRQLIRAQKAILISLAQLTEWRDTETGNHLERSRNYAVVLAKQLRKKGKYKRIITNEYLEDLHDAATLHDIGKVAIPDSILLKEDKLTDDEYEKMKSHVLVGERILTDVIDKFKLKQSFIVMGRNICGCHHEKYNGTGYPQGLYREEIPLEARIFAVCDAYDAIRSVRSFKGELSHKEAIKRIKFCSGEQFDPDIVEAFLLCRKRFWEISETFK